MKIKLLSLIIFLSVSLSGFAFGDETPKPERTLYEELETFQKALQLIKRKYVTDFDASLLMRNALEGMLKGLDDPYSLYLSPAEKEVMDRQLLRNESNLVGVGIEIVTRNEQVTVIAPIMNSPAYRAGIKRGDVITKVDGKSVRDVGVATFMIRGEVDTAVVLTVERNGIREPLEFTLTRQPISQSNVVQEILPEGVGYLRMHIFKVGSGSDMLNGLKYLELAGMEKLVLDLRSNPGGLLSEAAGVAELFLPQDELIVFTRGRKTTDYREFRSRKTYPYAEIPIVLLVNRGSASASEIVTGALKDHGRATIMGETTFGKGSVQEIMPLGDGAGLRLTTARYFTPNDISIDKTGIEPDLPLPSGDAIKAVTDESILSQSPLFRDPWIYAAFQELSE